LKGLCGEVQVDARGAVRSLTSTWRNKSFFLTVTKTTMTRKSRFIGADLGNTRFPQDKRLSYTAGRRAGFSFFEERAGDGGPQDTDS
jgi:hypothetical protein